MREILFRGKRVDNGEWVDGWYFQYQNKHFILPLEAKDSKHFYLMDYVAEIDIATRGEYTGLKDKNGVRVFEGDIISYRDMVFTIKWDGDNGRFLGFENKNRPDGQNYICYVGGELIKSEVTGNIHDGEGL